VNCSTCGSDEIRFERCVRCDRVREALRSLLWGDLHDHAGVELREWIRGVARVEAEKAARRAPGSGEEP
jgi:hypothetical protein